MSREENFNSQHLTHTELSNVTVLMLSSGYEPLFRTNWRRAMGAVLGGRAEVIRNHDGITIGTVSGDYPLPAVVRFTHGVIAARIKKRYKNNIFPNVLPSTGFWIYMIYGTGIKI